MEIKNLRIVERLEYALSAQFVDRLEEGGKINSNKKLRLKDLLKDVDGNPKAGETMENMKKELKRLKVIENRESPSPRIQESSTRGQMLTEVDMLAEGDT